GSFQHDNDVQVFSFNVGASSNVTLRAWSYAGGTNAAGQHIAAGGFDTILAVFNSTGTLIGQNDDGGCGLVAADPVTGRCWDTYLTINNLAAGSYFVSIQQYDNFANGPNFSNGYRRDGSPNFTGGCFRDVSNHCRTDEWAFDILNVN